MSKLTQIDYEHVELILKEADGYGLRYEVKSTAEEFIKQGIEYIEAFECAYQDWIK